MSEIFQIEFFGSQISAKGIPIFYPGQNVHAKVVLRLLEPMNAKSIDLHISGKAEVLWRIDETNGNHTKRIPVRSEAIYLNQYVQLWAQPNQQILPNIEHIFPFQFTVPPNCPPSFGEIDNKGYIQYACSVSIDRPCKCEKKVKFIFLVSSFLDLNTIECALSPVNAYNTYQNIGCCFWSHQSNGCCFWKHGKIKTDVHLPKSGFVPGEWIPFSIKIENRTAKQVKKVKVKLLQNAIYVAQKGRILHYDFTDGTIDWSIDPKITKRTKREERSRKIAEMEEHFILDPGLIGTFQGHLAVPPCTSSFNKCPVIRLNYSLETVKLLPSLINFTNGGKLDDDKLGPNEELKMRKKLFQVTVVTSAFCGGSRAVQLPILIGTIPINEEYSNSSIGNPNLVNQSFTQPIMPPQIPAKVIPSHPSPYSCYSEHPLPLPTNKKIYSEQLMKNIHP